MAVVDASIVVRLLQNRARDTRLREWFSGLAHLHAPMLIDAEVASAVRGLLRTSKPTVSITAERAGQMLDDYSHLPLVRYPMQPFHPRVLQLRHNFTAYDAFYVALAESLNMTLVTGDQKFARAPNHVLTIETWV